MRLRLTIASLLLFSLGTLAHAQKRAVYDVYAIEFGLSNTWTPISEIAIDSKSTDSVRFAFYVWYLKGDSGKKVLVDAGFLEDPAQRDTDIVRSVERYQRPDSALQRLHVSADEITDVVITHPHWDHIGGLDLFKKATVWIQRKDFAYFVGDAWQKGADNKGLKKADVPKIIRANLEGRLRLIDGDSVEIIPGIRVFTGSKHTFESQHLLVQTKTENVLLASDDAWFYYNIEHAVSVPLTFDAVAYARGLRRMKTLVSNPALIIPGHDALVMSRFERVAEGVVKIR